MEKCSSRAFRRAIAKAAKYDFCSTQFNLPEEEAAKVTSWVERHIPKDQRVEGDSGEATPHITALYGLENNDPAAVSSCLGSLGTVVVKLGVLGVFRNNPDHDVLFIRAHGAGLQRANRLLRKLPNQNRYRTYKPHVTLAYVKKGAVDRWEKNADFQGTRLEFDRIFFSSNGGGLTAINLRHPIAKAAEGNSNDQKSGVAAPAGATNWPTLSRLATPIQRIMSHNGLKKAGVVEPKPFSLNQEALKNEGSSEKEFHRALNTQHPHGIDLYHETFHDAGKEIEKHGFEDEDSVFCTAGKPGGFITTPKKAIVKVHVKPEHYHLVTPDMRYHNDEVSPHAALLKEHGGVHGADVCLNYAPKHWIRGVEFQEGGGGKLAKSAPATHERLHAAIKQHAELIRGLNTSSEKQPHYSSTEDFVAREGKHYQSAPLPAGVKMGAKKQCFMNAAKAALDNHDLDYAEGFTAIDGLPELPIHHAWVVHKKTGLAHDVTVDKPGPLVGTVIPKDKLSESLLRTGVYGGVLSGPAHRNPVLAQKWTPGHGGEDEQKEVGGVVKSAAQTVQPKSALKPEGSIEGTCAWRFPEINNEKFERETNDEIMRSFRSKNGLEKATIAHRPGMVLSRGPGGANRWRLANKPTARQEAVSAVVSAAQRAKGDTPKGVPAFMHEAATKLGGSYLGDFRGEHVYSHGNPEKAIGEAHTQLREAGFPSERYEEGSLECANDGTYSYLRFSKLMPGAEHIMASQSSQAALKKLKLADGKPLTPARLAGLVEFRSDKHGLKVVAKHLECRGKNVDVRCDILDSRGNKAGYLSRNFEFDSKGRPTVVNHELVELYREHQNHGFAGDWSEACENRYREAGFESIHLYANLDVGGYVWAKQGFDFTEKNDLEFVRGMFVSAINSVKISSIEVWADAREEVARMRHAWEFAAWPGSEGRLADEVGGEFGKYLMLKCGWDGRKALNPEDEGYKVGQNYRAAKKRVMAGLMKANCEKPAEGVGGEGRTQASGFDQNGEAVTNQCNGYVIRRNGDTDKVVVHSTHLREHPEILKEGGHVLVRHFATTGMKDRLPGSSYELDDTSPNSFKLAQRHDELAHGKNPHHSELTFFDGKNFHVHVIRSGEGGVEWQRSFIEARKSGLTVEKSLHKAHIKGHQRITASGKVVSVRPYDDSRLAPVVLKKVNNPSGTFGGLVTVKNGGQSFTGNFEGTGFKNKFSGLPHYILSGEDGEKIYAPKPGTEVFEHHVEIGNGNSVHVGRRVEVEPDAVKPGDNVNVSASTSSLSGASVSEKQANGVVVKNEGGSLFVKTDRSHAPFQIDHLAIKKLYRLRPHPTEADVGELRELSELPQKVRGVSALFSSDPENVAEHTKKIVGLGARLVELTKKHGPFDKSLAQAAMELRGLVKAHVKGYLRTSKKTGKATPVVAHEDKRTAKRLARQAAPHIQRAKKRGGEFAYLDSQTGAAVRRKGELERIKSLVIPPAWTDVWISPDPNSHLQAEGKAANGKWQPVYHSDHKGQKLEEKWERLKELSGKAEGISKKIERDLRSRDKDIREAAEVMCIVVKMGFRIGSSQEALGEKDAYGLLTLLGKHVTLGAKQVKFDFPGKQGVRQLHITKDPLIMEIVSRRKAGAKEQVWGEVTYSQVRRYMRRIGAGGFKPHDFRSLLANVVAAEAVMKQPLPKDTKEYEAARLAVAEQVGERLGDTARVCLKAYINPIVFYRLERAALKGGGKLVKSVSGKRNGVKTVYRGMSQAGYAKLASTGVYEPNEDNAHNDVTEELETAKFYASTKVHDEPGVVVKFQVPTVLLRPDKMYSGDHKVLGTVDASSHSVVHGQVAKTGALKKSSSVHVGSALGLLYLSHLFSQVIFQRKAHPVDK